MKKITTIVFILAILGCNRNPPEPTELYNKYRNSVVLIKISYYFKSFFNGKEFYFILGGDKGQMFFKNEKEAIKNADTAYGTGFIISDRGEIATNRHVAYPSIDDFLPGVSRSEAKNFELKRIFLGVAYDDTYVTDWSDFKECVVIKKANDKNIDLAIIQLKGKKTPKDIENIFSLKEIEYSKKININDNVYMIGFNHGIALANTNYGIQSQFTHGTVTQAPDNVKILYSIPTLPGSSGSPVMDKWGHLVAINFAGIGEGFNFGIPSLALAKLYNDDSQNVTPDEVTPDEVTPDEIAPDEVAPDEETTDEETAFKEIITGFIQAEDERDFNQIYSYFSPKISRYYDIKNPDRSKLEKAYTRSWEKSFDSFHLINSIEKVNKQAYDLKTTYKFTKKIDKTEHAVESSIRFIFDANGKIIEIYGID